MSDFRDEFCCLYDLKVGKKELRDIWREIAAEGCVEHTEWELTTLDKDGNLINPSEKDLEEIGEDMLADIIVELWGDGPVWTDETATELRPGFMEILVSAIPVAMRAAKSRIP